MSKSFSTKDIFKDKNYPKWIYSHKIFSDIKEIRKVFPSIGLPNFQCDVNITNIEDIIDQARYVIVDIKKFLFDYCELLDYVRFKKEKSIILSLLRRFSDFSEDIFIHQNDKVSIKLNEDLIIDNKIIFKKNESLFKIFNKINLMLETSVFPKEKIYHIENEGSFKNFSILNIPKIYKHKVVFSSDGPEGIWDIATMSMRGIKSCQSWDKDNGINFGVIGSMIDPFVGIIYIAGDNDKYNKYGSRMMRRCIVRFAIDITTRKPQIILDNMYPEYDFKIKNAFIKAISDQINNKINVFYGNQTPKNVYFDELRIPLTETRDKIIKCGNKTGDPIISYQDFKIPNKSKKEKSNYEWACDKEADSFLFWYNEILRKEILNLFKNSDINIFYKNKFNYDRQINIAKSLGCLAKDIISSVDKNDFTDHLTYVRRIYYNFFNKKLSYINKNKEILVKNINKRAGLYILNKFKIEHLLYMMRAILPEIDKFMKEKMYSEVIYYNHSKINIVNNTHSILIS